MCRNIKQLRQPQNPPTAEEIRLAALQYVRKVSGYRAPSRANREAFNQAVDEVAAATQRLLSSLVIKEGVTSEAAPGDRQSLAAALRQAEQQPGS